MRVLTYLFLLVASIFATALPAIAAVDINIDITSQTMHVSADNGTSYNWSISSAGRGYSTPDGNFRPQRLEVMHYSKKYHMAPMPHSIFFRGGYAIHGGYSAASMGVPRSHGCVRLTSDNAAILYALVREEGAHIHITGSPRFPVTYAKVSHHRKTARLYYLSHNRHLAQLRHQAHLRYLAYVRHVRYVAKLRAHRHRMAHLRYLATSSHHTSHYLAYAAHAGHSQNAAHAQNAGHAKVKLWQFNPIQFFR